TLARDHAGDRLFGDAEHFDQRGVAHDDPAAGDRAHRELFLTGNAELTHQEYVERQAEARSDFERDGHAAARQPDDTPIGAATVPDETAAKHAPGIVAISKIPCQNFPPKTTSSAPRPMNSNPPRPRKFLRAVMGGPLRCPSG